MVKIILALLSYDIAKILFLAMVRYFWKRYNPKDYNRTKNQVIKEEQEKLNKF